MDNVNIKIKQGKVTAIVGESGSGKSTIIQLLMHSLSLIILLEIVVM